MTSGLRSFHQDNKVGLNLLAMISIKYLSPESLSDTINVTQSQTHHIRQRKSKRRCERIVNSCRGECKVEEDQGRDRS